MSRLSLFGLGRVRLIWTGSASGHSSKCSSALARGYRKHCRFSAPPSTSRLARRRSSAKATKSEELLNEPLPCKAHSCFPRVLCHLTLLYRPGRTPLAEGHAYGWYLSVVVPPLFPSTLAAPLSERLVSETVVGLILATKASRPPAFAGCKAFTTGKSLEAVVPWM